jgi:hypothetical protein
VISFIDNSATPTLDASWFSERYEFMVGMAALILLPMLLIATIRAVVSQDISQLLRSFFVYLPVAICGTFAAVTITQALLVATDALSAAVAQNIAGDVSQIFDSVGSSLSGSVGGVPGAPSFAIFFGALLLVVGSFFVWIELLVRSAAVTVAVFFLPMVLAGLVWPAAMSWTKRLVEILMALILSKFVIVAVISLATAALAEPGKGGFGTVMGASALMLMAAFSPFVLLKLIPMAEGAAIDSLQGVGHKPIQAAGPNGGVHQTLSMMRSKTSSPKAAGLAVAGAGIGAGSAAAAGSGGGRSAAASMQLGKEKGKPPEGGPRSASKPATRKASGGEIDAPAKGPSKSERKTP